MFMVFAIHLGFWLVGAFLMFLWGRVFCELNRLGSGISFLPGNSILSTVYSAFFRGASSHLFRALTVTFAVHAALVSVVLLATWSFDQALGFSTDLVIWLWIFCATLALFSPLGRQGLTQRLSSKLSASYDRQRFLGRGRKISFHLADPDFKLTPESHRSAMLEITSAALGIRNGGANETFCVRSWLLVPAKSRNNKEAMKFQKTLRLPECLMKLHPGVRTDKGFALAHKLQGVVASLVCLCYLLVVRSFRIRRARDRVPRPLGPLHGVRKSLGAVRQAIPDAKISTLPLREIAVFEAIYIVAHAPREWQKLNAWTTGFEFS